MSRDRLWSPGDPAERLLGGQEDDSRLRHLLQVSRGHDVRGIHELDDVHGLWILVSSTAPVHGLLYSAARGSGTSGGNDSWTQSTARSGS